MNSNPVYNICMKLDLEFDATLHNDGRVEPVVELTSQDHSTTFGYLCGGASYRQSQELVDKINAPTPKIQAILDCISSAPDASGNVYWAFRYTCTLTGHQVVGAISGDESNLSSAKGRAGLCPSENVYYTYHELKRRDFTRLTSNWPYAGCPPSRIAEFIKEGLTNAQT